MKKYIFSLFIAVFLIGGVFVPHVNAQDASIEALQAQIQALLAKVAQLQAQVTQFQGGGSLPAFCYDFGRSLRLGDIGADVTALQTALQKQGYLSGIISGNFNSETFQGVVTFQEKYQKEVLASFGITRGTGFVGRTTRAQLNKLYGCVGKPIPPIPGVRSITVLSPNGGETWEVGSTHTISWNAAPATRVSIDVIDESTGKVPFSWTQTGFPAVVSNTGSFVWTIPISATSGNYRLKIGACPASISDLTCANTDLSQYGMDQSDNFFSIVLPTTTITPSITVLSPNGGEVWKVGEQHLLQWKASNLSSANVKLEICYTQPGLGYICNKNVIGLPAGVIAASIGQHNWSIPNDPYLLSGSNFRFRITDEFNNLLYDESDNSFSIVSATAAVPDFVIENVTLPSSVLINQEAVVTFTVTNRGSGTFLWEKYGHGVPWRVAGGETAQRLISDGCYTSVNIVPGAGCRVSIGLTYATPGTPTWVLISIDPDNKIAETNKNNNTANKSFTVSAITQPSITVLSPNGGGAWQRTKTEEIRWTSQNVSETGVVLYLMDQSASPWKTTFIAKNIDPNAGSYFWTVPADIRQGSRYKIFISGVIAGATLPYVGTVGVADLSDNFFSVCDPTGCG